MKICQFIIFLFILVLQQAGRNPSQATLNKHWTPSTTKLNFDDFCEIVKNERPTEVHELMRAFRKMDINGDGYISHNELHIVLTSVSTASLKTFYIIQIFLGTV